MFQTLEALVGTAGEAVDAVELIWQFPFSAFPQITP